MTEATNLHDTTDAAVWAAEFCKIWPSALCQAEGSEGVSDGDDFEATMIGWFANAIMAGVDREARQSQQVRSECDALKAQNRDLLEALERIAYLQSGGPVKSSDASKWLEETRAAIAKAKGA